MSSKTIPVLQGDEASEAFECYRKYWCDRQQRYPSLNGFDFEKARCDLQALFSVDAGSRNLGVAKTQEQFEEERKLWIAKGG